MEGREVDTIQSKGFYILEMWNKYVRTAFRPIKPRKLKYLNSIQNMELIYFRWEIESVWHKSASESDRSNVLEKITVGRLGQLDSHVE